MLRGIRIRPLLKTGAVAAGIGLCLNFFGGNEVQEDVQSLLFSLLYYHVQPEFDAFFSVVWALFPYIIFLLMVYTLLDEDLTVVSIYLFTRSASRLSWYCGKILLLFIHVVLYTVGLFSGMLIGAGFGGNLLWNIPKDFFAFTFQWILFFFTTSLIVNLFGCKFPPHLVLLASLCGIFLLSALACAPAAGWCFHLNPITHYFFTWNALRGEIQYPVVLWIAVACFTAFAGYFCIRKSDVALSDKENT